MEVASDLPDELQLYLALVAWLRERGLSCASMQVDCRRARDSESLVVTGTPQARSLLSKPLEREIGRRFDPSHDTWLLAPDEAWRLIDCSPVS